MITSTNRRVADHSRSTVDLSIVNYAHGGSDCDADRACGTWDYDGLRRIMRGPRWPDILIVFEGERWALTGGDGGWGAAVALRREQRELGLTERPYVPLFGTDPGAEELGGTDTDHQCARPALHAAEPG
ncbi:hypothetical protein INP57_18095 [Saccharopolyspora sp. HNM0986]|uniref:hypothetical protein n=1 Tax=Saccharopolyspora galaxeae TaxID=2781241 RepID=UPI0019094F0F|nr:hypothetical protein [Saccharopolyspora sp. HNM0986]MBK0868726.1 hypothetical protein [Saccharopolyspora sp. HNM0986]